MYGEEGCLRDGGSGKVKKQFSGVCVCVCSGVRCSIGLDSCDAWLMFVLTARGAVVVGGVVGGDGGEEEGADVGVC